MLARLYDERAHCRDEADEKISMHCLSGYFMGNEFEIARPYVEILPNPKGFQTLAGGKRSATTGVAT